MNIEQQIKRDLGHVHQGLGLVVYVRVSDHLPYSEHSEHLQQTKQCKESVNLSK